MAEFEEKQSFTQWWILLLGLFEIAIVAWVFTLPLPKDIAPGSPLYIGLVVWCLAFASIVPLMIVAVRLKTEVLSDRIRIQFVPFHRQPKDFLFSEIQSADVRTYRPLAEYGGWGLRRGPGGVAYNVKGNRGLQLVMSDGRRILIGTQKPDELLSVVRRYKS
jgi:hypothetical protein